MTFPDPMTFRVVSTDESAQNVLGEFENLAYADVFTEALMHQCCQPARVERWDGREWVAL